MYMLLVSQYRAPHGQMTNLEGDWHQLKLQINAAQKSKAAATQARDYRTAAQLEQTIAELQGRVCGPLQQNLNQLKQQEEFAAKKSDFVLAERLKNEYDTWGNLSAEEATAKWTERETAAAAVAAEAVTISITIIIVKSWRRQRRRRQQQQRTWLQHQE